MHLGNVIWRALTTRQAHLGHRVRSASKFDKEVCLLGGFATGDPDDYAAMAELLAPGEQVGLFLEADVVVDAAALELVSSAGLVQMVRDGGELPATDDAFPIAALTEVDVPEMMALTELTKPGPFNRRTREMGDYFGIRSEGRLLAMAGQRLRVPGFIEVSAVCTHPDRLGRGHAAALMAAMIRRIAAAGEQPFLHVRPENTRAIALYERLGFEQRWVGRYVILQRS